jgi:hypothetical protein
MVAPQAARRSSGLWRWALVTALAAGGCARSSSNELVVATDLPEPKCAALAAEFSAWVASHPELADDTPRLAWTRLRPGEDVGVLVERGCAVDVILGSAANTLRRLDETGLLQSPGPGQPPFWRECARLELGFAADPARLAELRKSLPHNWGDLGNAALAGHVALDDPRHDPVSLALARSALAPEREAGGFADLVRAYANARLIGRWRGCAAAGLERSAVTTAVVDRASLAPAERFLFSHGCDATSGVALAKNAGNPQLGKLFMQFLAERGEASVPPAAEPGEPGSELLLADLLGAVLVDSREELVLAVEVLARAGRPDLAAKWLTAPPWPPASIKKLLRKDPTGTLVEELATQIAPDLDLAIWLVESWKGPQRTIDIPVLQSLAGAVDGKLLAEPRFRAWLRAEWAAWARQNYRRIVRQLEKAPA